MILFYEMMHVWQYFFIPAVILAFVTIVSIVCSLALRELEVPRLNRLLDSLLDSLLESFPFWWSLPRALLLSIGLMFLISWGLYLRWRPRLGTED